MGQRSEWWRPTKGTYLHNHPPCDPEARAWSLLSFCSFCSRVHATRAPSSGAKVTRKQADPNSKGRQWLAQKVAHSVAHSRNSRLSMAAMQALNEMRAEAASQAEGLESTYLHVALALRPMISGARRPSVGSAPLAGPFSGPLSCSTAPPRRPRGYPHPGLRAKAALATPAPRPRAAAIFETTARSSVLLSRLAAREAGRRLAARVAGR
jgi:hypothetical protein